MTRITRADAQRAIDAKTKPLGALGRLEAIGVRLAVLQDTLAPTIDHPWICVFAADHGVATEGVSAYPRSVTAEMTKNFGRGGAAINVIARCNGIDVDVIDVGVDADLTSVDNVYHAKVRRGTRNFRHEAAMSSEELKAAMEAGRDAVRRALQHGATAIGFGEMGIGNTTAAAALLGVLTGLPAAETVGRGTGIDDDALSRKRIVVDEAIALHGAHSARECLRCLGGLEIAAMAGGMIEAAQRGIAVVADGFISTVALVAAARIAAQDDPATLSAIRDATFVAHRSTEVGHVAAIAACATMEIDARPILDLDMRLGEGTGAALAIPVLRSAAAVMREMATFESAGVSAGERASVHGTS